jgi:DNA gyrase/topoisomerase IV subunit A
MSTSPERRAANAANAKLSTGPRTPEGQARSSQNARTHGLTARDVVIAPDEHEEFEQLRADYQATVQPQDGIQQSLFEELLGAAWNLRRIRRMEVRACSDKTLTANQLEKDLDRLVRYKTCIERTFHRSLKELKALQTNAAIQNTLPVQLSPLTNATEISKRTQPPATNHRPPTTNFSYQSLHNASNPKRINGRS